jgi:hypothetical protein
VNYIRKGAPIVTPHDRNSLFRVNAVSLGDYTFQGFDGHLYETTYSYKGAVHRVVREFVPNENYDKLFHILYGNTINNDFYDTKEHE